MAVHVGLALRNLRGRDTQEAVAAVLNVTQATVSRWEKGDSTPDVEQMLRLEDHYKKPHGTVLRHAGLIDDIVTLRDAIEAAPELTPEIRGLFLRIYEAAQGADDDSASASKKPATKRAARRH